jgi:hypothetical protein
MKDLIPKLRKILNGGSEMREFGWDHKNLILNEKNPETEKPFMETSLYSVE